jgi:hypothetical protein
VQTTGLARRIALDRVRPQADRRRLYKNRRQSGVGHFRELRRSCRAMRETSTETAQLCREHEQVY